MIGLGLKFYMRSFTVPWGCPVLYSVHEISILGEVQGTLFNQ